MRYVLGIDQGTTGTTVLLVDESGEVAAHGYQEIRQFFPQAAWVEHDPNDIWGSVLEATRQALAAASAAPSDIAAVGITNQRETTVAWDPESGAPLHHAIVWQCRRTAATCDQLREKGLEDAVRARTGLTLDAYFSGTKVRWLLENVSAVKEAHAAGRALFGTVDAWVLARLTAGRTLATDPTNASRTLLYNTREGRWDADLWELLELPADLRLPEVRPSGGDFGRTDPEQFLGIDAPIRGILGDQQAALYGQGCWTPGTAKVTFGTGAFLLLNVGAEPVDPPEGLLLTAASDAEGNLAYALEGAVFIAGAAIQWLRDQLQIVEAAPETEAMARSVDDNLGVYFVPAFVGLGAPYWDQDARGAILGLTRGTSRAHIARAALEAIAYQTRDVLDVMRRGAHLDLPDLRVDGGAAKNDFLCEFLSGLLSVPVDRPHAVETTGLGASYLAGLGAGVYDAARLAELRRTERVFEPGMAAEVADALYLGWQTAVGRVRSDARG